MALMARYGKRRILVNLKDPDLIAVESLAEERGLPMASIVRHFIVQGLRGLREAKAEN